MSRTNGFRLGRSIRVPLMGLSLILASLTSVVQAQTQVTGVAPGRYQVAMRFADLDRRYVLYVPHSSVGRGPVPLVVALHGSGGTANAFIDESNWSSVADRHGFVVVAPEGVPMAANYPTGSVVNPRVWNSGQFGAQQARSQIDDVSFIIAVIDDASAKVQINTGRVYASGYSTGGSMAFRLAAERADRFTAIASVAGLCWVPDPHPARAIPTMVVLGKLDPLVPIRGGMKVLPWEIHPSPPVKSVMSRWASAIGCPTEPRTNGWSPAPGVKVDDYGPGVSGSLLRVMYVQFQGHGLPGGKSLRPERLLGPDISSLDSTEAIWNFFQGWAY